MTDFFHKHQVDGNDTGQVSRIMGRTCKYCLTSLGKQVITPGLKLKNLCDS